MKIKYKILGIIFTLIFLILGSGMTYSIFNSHGNLNFTDKNIAKFVFNAKTLDELELSLIDLKPGDSEEYSFSVSNNEAGISSNVSIEYQMVVKTYHLVPLIIELYKINGEDEELILNCDESYTRNEQNELICNTQVQSMEYYIEKLDNYKLKVTFPTEYNDALYADLVDYVDIEIKSWQKIGD